VAEKWGEKIAPVLLVRWRSDRAADAPRFKHHAFSARRATAIFLQPVQLFWLEHLVPAAPR